MIQTLTAPLGMMLFAYTMVYAAVTDLTTMKIRNALIVALLAGYALLAPAAGFSLAEIGASAALAAATLVLGFICFACGWIGGGDVKLATVTALWLGIEQAPSYLALTAILGGVFTLLILQFRTLALPIRLQGIGWIARLHERGEGVPYGVALALAALTLFPQTRWMTGLV